MESSSNTRRGFSMSTRIPRTTTTTRLLNHSTGLISWSLSLNTSTLQFTVLILSTLLLISTPGEGRRPAAHRCYVCLPQDKTSSVAKDIISAFPGQSLTDCSSFNSQNAHQFQVDCPADHVGCQLRINGSQISRTCSPLAVNDCKTANSVEFCYCAVSLCNGDHPARRSKNHAEEQIRLPREDETDDEDLIQPFSHHEGSGFGDGDHEESEDIHKPMTTSTEKSSHPHPNQGDADSHLKHNVIPEEKKGKIEEEGLQPIASNAMKKMNLNMNQFIFSILSSFCLCFLVKSQSL